MLCDRPVAQIDVADGIATGVTFVDGRQLKAKAVLVNADPFRIQQLVGAQHLPPDLNSRLDAQKIDGSVLKASCVPVSHDGQTASDLCGQVSVP